jgi:hypothetical protein
MATLSLESFLLLEIQTSIVGKMFSYSHFRVKNTRVFKNIKNRDHFLFCKF